MAHRETQRGGGREPDVVDDAAQVARVAEAHRRTRGVAVTIGEQAHDRGRSSAGAGGRLSPADVLSDFRLEGLSCDAWVVPVVEDDVDSTRAHDYLVDALLRVARPAHRAENGPVRARQGFGRNLSRFLVSLLPRHAAPRSDRG